MKTVVFYNWSDESFTWTWAKEPWTFEAGQKIYIQDYLGDHFAKHLVDRELIKHGKPTDYEKAGDPFSRSVLEKRTIIAPDVQADASVVKRESEILNQNSVSIPEPQAIPQPKAQNLTSDLPFKPFCDQCDSKGIKHKKVCPKYVEPFYKTGGELKAELHDLNK